MTRRFEFIEGRSAKFWQITTSGKEVEVCFGRLGTSGQLLKKILPDEAAATRHAEKLIGEKLAKGYTEVRIPALA